MPAETAIARAVIVTVAAIVLIVGLFGMPPG